MIISTTNPTEKIFNNSAHFGERYFCNRATFASRLRQLAGEACEGLWPFA